MGMNKKTIGIILFLGVVLVAIIFATLSSGRVPDTDTVIKSLMSQVKTEASIYIEENETYDGFCETSSLIVELQKFERGLDCSSSGFEYDVTISLEDGSSFVVESEFEDEDVEGDLDYELSEEDGVLFLLYHYPYNPWKIGETKKVSWIAGNGPEDAFVRILLEGEDGRTYRTGSTFDVDASPKHPEQTIVDFEMPDHVFISDYGEALSPGNYRLQLTLKTKGTECDGGFPVPGCQETSELLGVIYSNFFEVKN